MIINNRIIPNLIRRHTVVSVCRVTRGFAKQPPPIDPQYLPKQWYVKKYHEPPYLEYLKPRIPFYDLINCQVKGYDFAVLESYVRFIQKTAKNMNLKVNKYWALPAVTYRYDTLQDLSNVVDSSNTLKIYERNVQMKHVTSRNMSIFIEAIQAGKPPGVLIKVKRHEPQDEEVRYIPDLKLAEMEKELEEWKQPVSVLEKSKKKI